MLPKLGQAFDRDKFRYEVKWDGTRTLAFIEHGTYRLVNRRRQSAADRYPELRTTPRDVVRTYSVNQKISIRTADNSKRSGVRGERELSDHAGGSYSSRHVAVLFREPEIPIRPARDPLGVAAQRGNGKLGHHAGRRDAAYIIRHREPVARFSEPNVLRVTSRKLGAASFFSLQACRFAED